MFFKLLLPVLALAGAVFAVRRAVATNAPVPVAAPLVAPSASPFDRFVAGAGIVEASSENVAIGAPVGGVVVAVSAAVGDAVKPGQPLFRLDDRSLQADLAVKQAAVNVAAAQLDRLKKSPRAEDLPPLEAKVVEADVLVKDLKDELARWQSVADPRAVAQDVLLRKRFGVAAAEARLSAATADLSKAKAGAWEPDLAIANAELAAAQASVAQVLTELDRLVVRATVAGRVLQVKTRPGEFASAGALAQPLMVIGTVEPLHLRIDVDEHDAWRAHEKARAHATVRGNAQLATTLTFVRFEPYVVPKRSLTGDSSERVDTRVLQVIYRVDDPKLRLFVGQQMDVTIESEDPVAGTAKPADPAPGAGEKR